MSNATQTENREDRAAAQRHQWSDSGRTAGHHWTQLETWATTADLWHVTTADFAISELGDELTEVCYLSGEEVGALLLRGHSNNGLGAGYAPHALMLTGQTPTEERITLENLTWAIMLRSAIFDQLPTTSSWQYRPVNLRGGGHARLVDARFSVLAIPNGRLLFPDREAWTMG